MGFGIWVAGFQGSRWRWWWWWVISAWVRFVICGCELVLWCAMGLFCGGCAAFLFIYFVCDWWFCLVWVEEKYWRFGLFCFVLFFCFFFWLMWIGGRWWWWLSLWLWLWLMVECVVGVVDVFLGSGIYYFIVVVILFYYDVYIILLCWKLK